MASQCFNMYFPVGTRKTTGKTRSPNDGEAGARNTKCNEH